MLGTDKNFFGLDIGSSAIRAVQLKPGQGGKKALVSYQSVPVENHITQSDSPNDHRKVGQLISKLLSDAKISTKNVVIGAPSKQIYASIIDMPKMSQSEMMKSIGYTADQFIPVPVETVKVDAAQLGVSPKDPDQVEAMVAAAPNKFTEARLKMLEGIGLNVIAIEPDAFALGRALVAPSNKEAVLIIDMGAMATDLMIMYNNMPRLVRSINVGGDSIVKTAAQNLNIDENQASQFVYKFGLVRDKLEGQVHKAIISQIDVLISEIDKSIKFFKGRYENADISKIIVVGGASIIPDFPVHVVNKTQVAVEIGNAWLNTIYPQQIHNELMSISNKFGVAVGLAERS